MLGINLELFKILAPKAHHENFLDWYMSKNISQGLSNLEVLQIGF